MSLLTYKQQKAIHRIEWWRVIPTNEDLHHLSIDEYKSKKNVIQEQPPLIFYAISKGNDLYLHLVKDFSGGHSCFPWADEKRGRKRRQKRRERWVTVLYADEDGK